MLTNTLQEGMHLYKGDRIKMIMNAWYMANPENFPPSDDIEPLYVSVPLNSSIVDKIFRPAVINHFKAHQPIGCRDNHYKRSTTPKKELMLLLWLYDINIRTYLQTRKHQ